MIRFMNLVSSVCFSVFSLLLVIGVVASLPNAKTYADENLSLCDDCNTQSCTGTNKCAYSEKFPGDYYCCVLPAPCGGSVDECYCYELCH